MKEFEIEMNLFEQTYNSGDYEVWDEEEKRWIDYTSSCYVSSDFPKPTEAKYPINLITVKDSRTENVITFGTTQYTGKSKLVESYHYFSNELAMLEYFVRWFRKQKFDFITGWNVQNFDIPYIVNRINNLVEGDIELQELALLLSPLKKLKQKPLINPVNKKHEGHYYELAGITILDYMGLYKNFTFTTLESYSLQFVSMHELKKGKLDLDGAINQIYKTDWNTFVEYNIQDVLLVWEMELKKKFIELTIIMCYDSLTPFDRVFSSIAIIEGYILRFMHERNLVMSDRNRTSNDWWHDERYFIVKDKFGLPYYQNCKENEKDFEPFYVKGGHVEAYPGLWKKVISNDILSSYPHQVMQYNISPETKVIKPSKELIDSGMLIRSEVNGVYYKRTENAVLPTIVKQIFDERKYFKKLKSEADAVGDKALAAYYDSQQHIRKILINSMYGVLANKYFHFYDVDNARAITRGGRVTVRYLAACANSYVKDNFHKIGEKVLGQFIPGPDGLPQKINNNIVVLIDTDSNYYCLDEIYQKYCPKMDDMEFFEKMEAFLDPFFSKILTIKSNNNDMKQVIVFKREGYILKQFILAKKKYITELLKNEDDVYDPPKIKVTGVELKKSDTPAFCKQELMLVVKDILDNTNKELNIILLNDIKKQFKKQSFDLIARKSSIQEYSKFVTKPISYYLQHGVKYESGALMTAKASLNYNYIINKFKYPLMPIANGSKIKYLSVYKDNKFSFDTIAWIGNYPIEFHDLFKIDYDEQFRKTFLSVIERMWVVLGWCDVDKGIILNESKLSKFIKR
jgi:DNA polymerase elongation subunit (family B)